LRRKINQERKPTTIKGENTYEKDFHEEGNEQR